MEIYTFNVDVQVFGNEVKTFPIGISEAFDNLSKTIANGLQRTYYGISYMTADGGIIYKAATLEKFNGEAEKYNCERYIIEKGSYLTETIYDWRNKINCIKDVFHGMMKDRRYDNNKPCVEWYKTDDEMLCMIKKKDLL